jgi:hypothetical protein
MRNYAAAAIKTRWEKSMLRISSITWRIGTVDGKGMKSFILTGNHTAEQSVKCAKQR